MNKVIIYRSNSGGVVEVFPTPDILRTRTVEEVAQKDVPYGKPYKIIDKSDLPIDQTFRNAWTVNEADLTDGVGAESNEFSVKEQA